MPLSVKDLETKIDALYETARQIQMERDELNEKARRHRERRDQLNGQVRELLVKANECRAQRDKLNAQIQAHKQRRDEAADAARLTRAKMREMGIDLKKLPRIPPEEEIREEIDRLEWDIQTRVHSIQAERKLVDKAENLRKELKESHALRERLREVGDRRIEADALRISSNKLHSKIISLSEESQLHHRRMMEFLEQSKPQRDEADANHRQMMELIAQADQKHAELTAVRQEISKLSEKERSLDRKKEERRSLASEKKLRKRAEEALEKLRAGQKVELEDLMLLREFNLM